MTTGLRNITLGSCLLAPKVYRHRDTETGEDCLECTTDCAFSVPPCLCGNRPFSAAESVPFSVRLPPV